MILLLKVNIKFNFKTLLLGIELLQYQIKEIMKGLL